MNIRGSVAQIYRSHWRWLIAIAKRRFGPALAEEDVQTAFLNVLARSPQAVDQPKAVLARAVVNAGLDRLRSGSFVLDPRASAEYLALDTDRFPLLPDQETALLLKQVILALPTVYRDTFILNRFMGLTYAEIAQRQGVTQKAVEYRMSRALALCAEALRD